jgi:hypothetical protein
MEPNDQMDSYMQFVKKMTRGIAAFPKEILAELPGKIVYI